MSFADRIDQCIPDCFNRCPTNVLQAASITPEPTKSPFDRNMHTASGEHFPEIVDGILPDFSTCVDGDGKRSRARITALVSPGPVLVFASGAIGPVPDSSPERTVSRR
jgi:hypothetical protein